MSYFEKYPTAAPPKRRTWDVTDVGIVIGVGGIIAGVAWIHLPSALILGGAAVVALVMLTTLDRGDDTR